MRGIKPTNTSNASQNYAIEGNVKDLTRLVMSEADVQCPMKVLNLFIQHIFLYGSVFGKDKSIIFRIYSESPLKIYLKFLNFKTIQMLSKV